jgi:hypothetical protein
MTRVKPLPVTKECARPECGESFEVIPTRATEARREYCSRQCSMKVINVERGLQKQREWDANPRSTCACGVGRIPYEVRNTTKYCSPECRITYGQKKQADPANYVTFDCKHCGETVTRYKSHGNYHKYCSNACAQKHTKTKVHIVVDEAVVLDSGWEALFWGLCAFQKLTVERYDRSAGVLWKANGWYAPDFWLPSLELAVEIKGQEDDSDAARWAAFRQKHPLAVLGREELEEACGVKAFLSSYLQELSSI